MRFRLASILLLTTLLAIVVAFERQIYSLQQQVRELQAEVQTLQQAQLGTIIYPARDVSPVGVPWDVERAMMLDPTGISVPRR